MQFLQTLEDRTYKSYKGRMQASQRLALRDKAWNASLLSLTLSTTIASIGLLTDGEMYGRVAPTLFVGLSVFALVISLVVAARNYGARSRDLFNNYRQIQRLSTEVEQLRLSAEVPSPDEEKLLLTRYNDLLDGSENHNSVDFRRASVVDGGFTWAGLFDTTLSILPFATLLIPVLVMLPFLNWLLRAW